MEATMFTGWIYDHLLPHAQPIFLTLTKIHFPLPYPAVRRHCTTRSRDYGKGARACSVFRNCLGPPSPSPGSPCRAD
jgi:hypothetical protein